METNMRKVGWAIALVIVLSVVIDQQIKLQGAAKREEQLWREILKWQEASSAAIRDFRKPLASAPAQPESWVAPLQRPLGGAK
jgi:hypothetical protein